MAYERHYVQFAHFCFTANNLHFVQSHGIVSERRPCYFMYECDRMFEHKASGLLDELYKIDEDNSHKLLTRELLTWKNSEVFELADKANLMDFMQHDCCQTDIEKMWLGRLSTRPAIWQVRLDRALLSVHWNRLLFTALHVPQKGAWKMHNGRFPCKIALRSKKSLLQSFFVWKPSATRL